MCVFECIGELYLPVLLTSHAHVCVCMCACSYVRVCMHVCACTCTMPAALCDDFQVNFAEQPYNYLKDKFPNVTKNGIKLLNRYV